MALAYQEFYTLDDYLQWEGNWELIEGMPYAMAPSPSVTHQTVGLNIAANIKERKATKNLAQGYEVHNKRLATSSQLPASSIFKSNND
jgi:hypothetical protein